MAASLRPEAQATGLKRLAQQSDVVLAAAVVLIVAMMIIPLPAPVLDVLISINISAGLIILLVSMYTLQPLDFSVFPSLLLIVTLFRLGLNVSATRLILLHGDAGRVIASFGQFVVGGSYVVGIVVFLILVIIQFVVITNGAGRVAEVAARFTLDAMPGKQMSIDADLNAGLITDKEARRRRRAIEQEADFYGAMDGASKFVKGDAIAGIVIIVVNIVGGIIIGIVQHGMGIVNALQTYTLLTVGDGLVSQIPALLVSTATGIIVTRAASESNLGRDVARQILANPRALAIVGAVLFGLGLVPGLPKIPFFLIGSVLAGTSFMLHRSARRSALAEPSTASDEAADKRQAENVIDLLQVDPMELEIGYGLIPLVDAEQGGSLLSRISLIRRQVALELGIVLPTIRIRDNLQLAPNAYAIKLRGVPVARGEALVGHYLAMNPGTAEAGLDGSQTTEPVFGLPALWIQTPQKERAELQGYTVVDAASVITTHLTEIIRVYAAQLLSRQDVQVLLDGLKQSAPAVVEDLIPGVLSASEVHRVLQNLLAERVPIRDLATILEVLADRGRTSRDLEVLTEYARHALGRMICDQYRDADGTLWVLTMSPPLEQSLGQALHQTDQGTVIALDPQLSHRLLERIAAQMERMAAAGHPPMLLVSSRIRQPLRRLAQRRLPNLVVLSYSEISPETRVHAEGTVTVELDA